MNDIFNAYRNFTIVYIVDVLIFSKIIDQHFKQLRIFLKVPTQAGLDVSEKKFNLCQTKIRFLGHNIYQGSIIPIDKAIQFADKFSNEIRDKTQLERVFGSLNYIAEFYKNLAYDAKPLFDRLRSNPPEWTSIHIGAVRKIKIRVKELLFLSIPHPDAFKIVETDDSKLGYGGFLKQIHNNKEQLVRYISGV
ncbi:hypothetical protein LINPERPRIM_LOCUS8515 [Linum perenne]